MGHDGLCRRFQTAHQLGVPTIVRGVPRGCDWSANCLGRVCTNRYIDKEKQQKNPEAFLQVSLPH